MKSIFTIHLILIVMMWIGCKKENNQPPVNEEAVKLKRELTLSVNDNDTISSYDYYYDHAGELSSMYKIDKQEGDTLYELVYSAGRLMTVNYYQYYWEKATYEYNGSIVKKTIIDTTGEIFSLRYYYLDDEYRAMKEVVPGDVDTLFYSWKEGNLLFIHSSSDTFSAFTYNEVKNPYYDSYKYLRINGFGSEYFLTQDSTNGFVVSQEITTMIDDYPAEYLSYRKEGGSWITHLEYK